MPFDPMKRDDNDDEVVSEHAVYLNGRAQNDLLVLQYSTRSVESVLSENAVSELRIKPKSLVVETDVSRGLPPAYCNTAKLQSTDSSGVQTYSGLLKPANERFAILTIDDNNDIHLNMVSCVGQLRPHFVQNENSKSNNERSVSRSSGEAVSSVSPLRARVVQMSAKGSGERQAVYSKTLEFWKHANEEPFENLSYRLAGPNDLDVLKTECREEAMLGDQLEKLLHFS